MFQCVGCACHHSLLDLTSCSEPASLFLHFSKVGSGCWPRRGRCTLGRSCPRWSKRAGRCRQWGTSCTCFGSVGSPSHGTGRASRASRGARVLHQHGRFQKSITPPIFPPQVTLTVCGGPHRKTGGSGQRWARQQAGSRQQPFCADFFWIFLDIRLLCLCHEHSRRLQKHSQGTGGEIGAGKAPEKGGWGLLGLVVD